MPPDETPLDDRLPSGMQRDYEQIGEQLRGQIGEALKRTDLDAGAIESLASAAVIAQTLDRRAQIMDRMIKRAVELLSRRGYWGPGHE